MSGSKRIALIGGGNIGISWAIVFAQAGHAVQVYDRCEKVSETALHVMRERLLAMDRACLLNENVAEITSRVTLARSIEDALDGAIHVQESVIEEIRIKRELFELCDRFAASTATLASSTSSFPISAFTEGLSGRERCLVVHPANPAHLLPIVEVVPSKWTSASVVRRTKLLLEGVGKHPVILEKEIDGFIFNRLQGAVLREAYALLQAGVGSVADIDAVMTSGLGVRWSLIGPFETADLNYKGGIREHAQRMGDKYARMAQKTASAARWDDALVARAEAERRKILPKEYMEARAAWRDKALMDTLAALQRIGITR